MSGQTCGGCRRFVTKPARPGDARTWCSYYSDGAGVTYVDADTDATTCDKWQTNTISEAEYRRRWQEERAAARAREARIQAAREAVLEAGREEAAARAACEARFSNAAVDVWFSKQRKQREANAAMVAVETEGASHD